MDNDLKIRTAKKWSLIGLLLAFTLPIILTSILCAIFSGSHKVSIFESGLHYTVSSWLCFGFLFLILKKLNLSFKEIGFVKLETKDFLYGFAFCILGIILFGITTPIFDFLGVEKMKAMQYSLTNFYQVISLIIFAVITAPICEETFFRGYGITVIGKWVGSPWKAGLICNVAFGLIHIPAFGLRGFIQIGLLWALLPVTLFIWRKSLYPGIIMHMLNNIFAYIILPIVFSTFL